jgi:hypothetical protein
MGRLRRISQDRYLHLWKKQIIFADKLTMQQNPLHTLTYGRRCIYCYKFFLSNNYTRIVCGGCLTNLPR